MAGIFGTGRTGARPTMVAAEAELDLTTEKRVNNLDSEPT